MSCYLKPFSPLPPSTTANYHHKLNLALAHYPTSFFLEATLQPEESNVVSKLPDSVAQGGKNVDATAANTVSNTLQSTAGNANAGAQVRLFSIFYYQYYSYCYKLY